jgi:HK97 family phage prohead protease
MSSKQKFGFERRYVQTEMRIDGQGRIEGHAAVFNEWSQDLGGFRERVRRGAFTKTLGEADVRALFNHDANYVLGRNRAGTLELSQDDTGLYFRATPPDTTWVADLKVSVRRGDINQGSFGFEAVRDDWKQEKNEAGDWESERELIEVKLFDVSIVTFPAYPQTAVGIRSLYHMLRSAHGQIEGWDEGAFERTLETLARAGAIEVSGTAGDNGRDESVADDGGAPGRAAHPALDVATERARLRLLAAL